MRQIELFSRSELASMRDRARARNYSAEGERFRRDHARHRDWGLVQRNGLRMMQLRREGNPWALAAARAGGWQALTAAQVMELTAAQQSADRASGDASPSGPGDDAADTVAGPVVSRDRLVRVPQIESAAPVLPAGENGQVRPATAGQAEQLERAVQAEPAKRAELAAQTGRDDRVEPVGRAEQRERPRQLSSPNRPNRSGGRGGPAAHGPQGKHGPPGKLGPPGK